MNEAQKYALAQHRRRERRRLMILLILLALAFLSLIFDVAHGPSQIAPWAVFKALVAPRAEVDATVHIIVWQLRLPVALMALVVGAALGVGGAQIQTLLNNPMASPYTLGLAASSGLGAALVLAYGSLGLPTLLAVPLGSFLMTMLCAAILFSFSMMKRSDSSGLVLVGIALLFLFQSLLSLVQFLSAPEISQLILFWLFGSLEKANWTNLGLVFLVTVLGVVLLLRESWSLTALRLGEAKAKSMGVDLNALRIKILWIVSMMTATAISFVGVIGFIGLVAPHLARSLLGEDQRFFMPGSMLIGALFLSLASLLSKIIIPGALFPVGIITALIGVPFFFWIVLGRKH